VVWIERRSGRGRRWSVCGLRVRARELAIVVWERGVWTACSIPSVAVNVWVVSCLVCVLRREAEKSFEYREVVDRLGYLIGLGNKVSRETIIKTLESQALRSPMYTLPCLIFADFVASAPSGGIATFFRTIGRSRS
jgi:hypothetical protein